MGGKELETLSIYSLFSCFVVNWITEIERLLEIKVKVPLIVVGDITTYLNANGNDSVERELMMLKRK